MFVFLYWFFDFMSLFALSVLFSFLLLLCWFLIHSFVYQILLFVRANCLPFCWWNLPFANRLPNFKWIADSLADSLLATRILKLPYSGHCLWRFDLASRPTLCLFDLPSAICLLRPRCAVPTLTFGIFSPVTVLSVSVLCWLVFQVDFCLFCFDLFYVGNR